MAVPVPQRQPFQVLFPNVRGFRDLFFHPRRPDADPKPVPGRAENSVYTDFLVYDPGQGAKKSLRARPLLTVVGALNRMLPFRGHDIAVFRLVERPDGILVTARIVGQSLVVWLALIDPKTLPVRFLL
jgi:hypothetical protein